MSVGSLLKATVSLSGVVLVAEIIGQALEATERASRSAGDEKPETGG